MCSKVTRHSLNAWPCDLSLISMHISEWCHFSDICISQGSVAICVKLDGIFKHKFVANLLPIYYHFRL